MTMTMIEKQYKMIKKEKGIKETNIQDDDYEYEEEDLESYESENGVADYNEPVVQMKPVKAKPKAKAKTKKKMVKNFEIDYPKKPKDTLSEHPKEIQNEIKKGK